MNSEPIDLLLLTALTEEAQVTVAVLDAVATQVDVTGRVRLYDYPLSAGRVARVAVVSAHQMGAVAMGVFAAPLLSSLRPRTACLIGIAAAVDTAAVHLGDVPFASQVFSYDDIAVEDGVLTFRTQGYQVDPMMRAAVGELRLSAATYRPWQDECERVIETVVGVLNQLRQVPIKPPKLERPSHLVVEIVAGGPFLLRDQDFREALHDLPKHRSVSVAAPVHPKLVSAEMESHGFMRAAHEHNVGAIVLKGISDVGDKDKARVEKETGGFFRAYACSNAVLAALHILRRREAISDQSHGVSKGGTSFAHSDPTASAIASPATKKPASSLLANIQPPQLDVFWRAWLDKSLPRPDLGEITAFMSDALLRLKAKAQPVFTLNLPRMNEAQAYVEELNTRGNLSPEERTQRAAAIEVFEGQHRIALRLQQCIEFLLDEYTTQNFGWNFFSVADLAVVLQGILECRFYRSSFTLDLMFDNKSELYVPVATTDEELNRLMGREPDAPPPEEDALRWKFMWDHPPLLGMPNWFIHGTALPAILYELIIKKGISPEGYGPSLNLTRWTVGLH
ncbi:MAG TPA: hypothetical protein VK539_01085 [Myxococcaceae bacterium]|nr:hypothetical protein [Myxococcaceae bacterium]